MTLATVVPGNRVRHPGLGVLEVSFIESSGRRLWAKDAEDKPYQMSIDSVTLVHSSTPLTTAIAPKPEGPRDDSNEAISENGLQLTAKKPSRGITITCGLKECGIEKVIPKAQYNLNKNKIFYCCPDHYHRGRKLQTEQGHLWSGSSSGKINSASSPPQEVVNALSELEGPSEIIPAALEELLEILYNDLKELENSTKQKQEEILSVKQTIAVVNRKRSS